MKKEKSGLFLVVIILCSFFLLTVLKLLVPEESWSKDPIQSISVAIGISAVLSALLLWVICIWDCLGNKRSAWVYVALFFFNWVAAIIYFFKYIYIRRQWFC